MGVLDIIHSFVNGTTVGFFVAVFVIFYVLSSKSSHGDSQSSRDSATTSGRREQDQLKERPPPEETLDILRSAISYLHNAQRGRLHVDRSANATAADHNESSAVPHHLTPQQLEKQFIDKSKDLRDRWKQIKALSHFVNDLGKTYGSFSKDLSKLSSSAKSNVSNSHAYDDEGFSDEWWRALSLACHSLSSDREHTGEYLCDEVFEKLSIMFEEQAAAEKRLTAEGARLITKLSESVAEQELRLRERDKYRGKVLASADKSLSAGLVIGGTDSKTVAKLQIREIALLEQTDKVQECIKEYMTLMPKIVSECNQLAITSAIETQALLVKIADAVGKNYLRSESVASRLKSHIVAVQVPGTTYGAAAGVKSGTGLHGYEESLQQVLENQADAVLSEIAAQHSIDEGASTSSGGAVTAVPVAHVVAADGSTIVPLPTAASTSATATATTHTTSAMNSHTSPSSAVKLDMTAESTACLAAVSSDSLPELPASFGEAIGSETAVWFNALSGRVYRDAARSEYFHGWLCEKLTTQLNKGKRPGYIDQVKVEEVTFGALPPLLCNIKWMPPHARNSDDNKHQQRPRTNSQTGATTKNRARSTSIRPSENSSSPKEEGGDHDDDEGSDDGDDDQTDDEAADAGDAPVSGATGDDAAAVPTSSDDARASRFSRSNSVEVPLPGGTIGEIPFIVPKAKRTRSSSTGKSKSNKKTGDNENKMAGKYAEVVEDDDAKDYDVECTADMAFRSGMRFKLTTKIWWNWPRDRYASMPITLMVDVVEICGRVRFGVTRSHSFMSFLEMPHTRFAVESEIGGDKFKVKNVPKLSEFIIKKMKKAISTKLVHPNSHKMRLVWPRNWWPEGTKHLFHSTSGGSADAASTPVGGDGKSPQTTAETPLQSTASPGAAEGDVLHPHGSATTTTTSNSNNNEHTSLLSAAGVSISKKIVARKTSRRNAATSSGKQAAGSLGSGVAVATAGGASTAPLSSVTTVHGAMQWLKKSFILMNQATKAGVVGGGGGGVGGRDQSVSNVRARSTSSGGSKSARGGGAADHYHGLGIHEHEGREEVDEEEEDGDDDDDASNVSSDGGESEEEESLSHDENEAGQKKVPRTSTAANVNQAAPSSVASSVSRLSIPSDRAHATVIAMLHQDSSRGSLIEAESGGDIVANEGVSAKKKTSLQIDVGSLAVPDPDRATPSVSVGAPSDPASRALPSVGTPSTRGRTMSPSPPSVPGVASSSTPKGRASTPGDTTSGGNSNNNNAAKSVSALAASAVDLVEGKLRAAFGRPRRSTLPDDLNVYKPCDILQEAAGAGDGDIDGDIDPTLYDESTLISPARITPSAPVVTAAVAVQAGREEEDVVGQKGSFKVTAPAGTSSRSLEEEPPLSSSSSKKPPGLFPSSCSSMTALSDEATGVLTVVVDSLAHSSNPNSTSIPLLEIPTTPTSMRCDSSNHGFSQDQDLTGIESESAAAATTSSSTHGDLTLTGSIIAPPAHKRTRSHSIGDLSEVTVPVMLWMSPDSDRDLPPRLMTTSASTPAPVAAPLSGGQTVRRRSLGNGKSPESRGSRMLEAAAEKSAVEGAAGGSSSLAASATFPAVEFERSGEEDDDSSTPQKDHQQRQQQQQHHQKDIHEWVAKSQELFKQQSYSLTAKLATFKSKALATLNASTSSSSSSSTADTAIAASNRDAKKVVKTEGTTLTSPTTPLRNTPPASVRALSVTTSTATAAAPLTPVSQRLSAKPSLLDSPGSSTSTSSLLPPPRSSRNRDRGMSLSDSISGALRWSTGTGISDSMKKESSSLPSSGKSDVSSTGGGKSGGATDATTIKPLEVRVNPGLHTEAAEDKQHHDMDYDESEEEEGEEEGEDSNNGFYRFDGEAMIRYRSRVRLYRGRSVSDAPMVLFATAASIFPNSVPEQQQGRTRATTSDHYNDRDDRDHASFSPSDDFNYNHNYSYSYTGGGNATGSDAEGFDTGREYISATTATTTVGNNSCDSNTGENFSACSYSSRRLSCGSSDFMDRGLSTASDRGEKLGAPWHSDMVQVVPAADQDIIDATTSSPRPPPQAIGTTTASRSTTDSSKQSTRRSSGGDDGNKASSIAAGGAEKKRVVKDVRSNKMTRFAVGTDTGASAGAGESAVVEGDRTRSRQHSHHHGSRSRDLSATSSFSPRHHRRGSGGGSIDGSSVPQSTEDHDQDDDHGHGEGRGVFPSRTAIMAMIKVTAAKKGSSFLRTLNNAILQPQERRYREFKRRQQKLREREQPPRIETPASTTAAATATASPATATTATVESNNNISDVPVATVGGEISGGDYVFIRPRAASAPVTSFPLVVPLVDAPVSSISVVSEVLNHEDLSLSVISSSAATDGSSGPIDTMISHEVISSERDPADTANKEGNDSSHLPAAHSTSVQASVIGSEIVSKILEGQVTVGIREAIHAVTHSVSVPSPEDAIDTIRRTIRSASYPQGHYHHENEHEHESLSISSTNPLELAPAIVPIPSPLFSSLSPHKLPASAAGVAIVRSGFLKSPTPGGERVFLELAEGHRIGTIREPATLRVYAYSVSDDTGRREEVTGGGLFAGEGVGEEGRKDSPDDGDDDSLGGGVVNLYPMQSSSSPSKSTVLTDEKTEKEKRKLVAIYDLVGAECRPAASFSDSKNHPFKSPDSNNSNEEEEEEGENRAHGFEVSFRSAKGKWLCFWSESEEDYGEWMDAFDLVVLSNG